MRALLVKGADRNAKDFDGKTPADMIEKSTSKELKSELKSILKTPRFMECCMVKLPMVPLNKNLKSVLLFSFLFAYIYINMFFFIFPGNILNLKSFRLALLVLRSVNSFNRRQTPLLLHISFASFSRNSFIISRLN